MYARRAISTLEQRQSRLGSEAGKVKLPRNAPWLDEWIEEHLRFPVGDHDDLVDTTAYALARLTSYVPRTFAKLDTSGVRAPATTRGSVISFGKLNR